MAEKKKAKAPAKNAPERGNATRPAKSQAKRAKA